MSMVGGSAVAKRPFFRYDLVTRAIQENGHRFVDVTDPDTGKTFRFYEVEYAVACGMDGQRDLDGLSSWAKEELGLEASAEELKSVVDTLAELGYLAGEEEGDEAAAGAASEPRSAAPTTPTPTPPVSESPAPMPPPPAPPAAPVDTLVAFDNAHDAPTGVYATEPEEIRASSSAAADSDADVALGAAGKSPIERAPRPPVPGAPDLELGFAGRSEVEPDRTATESDSSDVELGFAGGSELSTDLSAHVDIGTDDVKEAVRQSKVMQAVEVPDDVAAALGEDAAVEASKPAEEVVEEAPEAASAAKADKPIVLPDEPLKKEAKEAESDRAADSKPASAEKARPKKATATESPAEKRSSSAPIFLWILLLGAVGVGAWYVYTEYVVTGSSATSSTPQPVPQQETSEPPPPPPRPTATLRAGSVPAAEVAAGRDGVINWLAVAGTEVAEGEPVAKLSGAERYERDLQEAQESKARYQGRLDAATARGDKQAMAKAQSNVDRKQGDIEEISEKLAPYVMKAPIAGVVEPLVEPRARLSEGDPVATVTGEAGPSATFDLPEGESATEGDEVEVAAKDDGEVAATCVVQSVSGSSITVECQADSGLIEGSDVVLR